MKTLAMKAVKKSVWSGKNMIEDFQSKYIFTFNYTINSYVPSFFFDTVISLFSLLLGSWGLKWRKKNFKLGGLQLLMLLNIILEIQPSVS